MTATAAVLARHSFVALLLATVAMPGAELAHWAPDTHEHIEWCWRRESEHSLVATELVLEQELPRPHGIDLSDVRLAVSDSFELTSRDTLLELGEHGPLRLERELVRARRATTAALGLSADSGRPDTIETFSPLEGARLEFPWDAGTAAPQVAFAGEEQDPVLRALLDGVDEGLDLRDLLGGLRRAPGDAWSLDEEALLRLLRPGGELGLTARTADFEGAHDTAALAWLLSADLPRGSGEAWGRAEYERVIRDGGRRVARIALRATIECRGLVREALERLVDTLGSGRVWLEATKQGEVELRIDGVLLWDLVARRAHRLELEGRSETRLELELGLPDLEGELVLSLRGSARLRVEAALVD